MGTNVRNTLSKKNPYWISKHRKLELVHFCLQYPEWKREYAELNASLTASHNYISDRVDGGKESDRTADKACKMAMLSDRIEMVEQCCKDAGDDLYLYLLTCVTEENKNYPYLRTKMNIPCCKDVFYRCRDRFFWILDKTRN